MKIKKKVHEVPEISTASLPDMVFMMLFFFMVATNLREVDLRVKVELPEATQVEKIENKSLVNYIYVGRPFDPRFGTEPVIQIEDHFASLSDIPKYIEKRRSEVSEEMVPRLTTSVKASKDVEMGTITDIKQELRKVYALKIIYNATGK